MELKLFKRVLALFSSRPFVPPTQRQLDYAEQCGLQVNSKMDRQAVTTAIEAALAADPILKFKISARCKREDKQEQDGFEAKNSSANAK